jgi:hypothetical protein
MNLYHSTVIKDNRCVDLLLTEDEVVKAFERTLEPSNKIHINLDNCCDCWPTEKPPKCTFWSKIMGLCKECKE